MRIEIIKERKRIIFENMKWRMRVIIFEDIKWKMRIIIFENMKWKMKIIEWRIKIVNMLKYN